MELYKENIFVWGIKIGKLEKLSSHLVGQIESTCKCGEIGEQYFFGDKLIKQVLAGVCKKSDVIAHSLRDYGPCVRLRTKTMVPTSARGVSRGRVLEVVINTAWHDGRRCNSRSDTPSVRPPLNNIINTRDRARPPPAARRPPLSSYYI